MLQLRALGSVVLTDDDRPVEAVLRQPKRLGLLVYLALARPRGFHRRDALLALFWPELDTARARASLRQALYTLRRELPGDVLINRGDEEVGLRPGSLAVDVLELEARVAAGDAADALALYRGELLPGFYVADASPELERWLDGERARALRAVLEVTTAAAERAERAGELEEALRWTAQAAALSPVDEELARAEIELRHRTGDRTGALLAYEQWAGRLKETLGLRPSAATLRVIEEVRASPPASAAPPKAATPAPPPPVAEPDAPRAVPPGAAAPGAAAPDASTGAVPHRARTGGGRNRRWRLAALVAIPVLVGVGAMVLPIRPPWSESGAAPAASRMMVLPFAYSGTGEAQYLSEGLVYLFSVALDGGEVRVMEPAGVIRRASEGGDPARDRVAAGAVAERLGAGSYVSGSVVETPGALQLTASLYRTGSQEPVAQASAAGPASELLRLVESMAGELLTAQAGADRVTRLASFTSGSLPALKAYLTGERLLRHGRFDEAIHAFEEAVAADSLFALGHYRISQAASWAFRGDLATRAASQAVRHADRLPERERRLLMGHEAYRRGEASTALRMLADLSVLYPDDPEVWYRLGETRIHFGPLQGWSVREAVEPFLRTIELDTAHVGALTHLAQLAALSADTAQALAYSRAALRVAPEGARAPQLRVLMAVLGAGDAWGERLDELQDAGDFTVVSSVYNVAVYGRRPDRARDVARLLVRPSRPPQTRAFGWALLAGLELSLGRTVAANEALDALSKVDPAHADRDRALLATAPAAHPDTVTLRRLVRRLDDPAADLPTASFSWGQNDRYDEVGRLLARGTAAGLLGDAAVVGEVIGKLGLEVDALHGDGALDLALLGAAGDPAIIGAPVFAVPAEEAVLSLALSRPARRLAEARRLESEGRLRDALVWYESLATFSVQDLAWGIPAFADRARIHRTLGEDERAAALLRRLVTLWRDADRPEARAAALRQLVALDAQPR